MKRKTHYRIGKILYSVLGIFSVLAYFFTYEFDLVLLSLISLAIVYQFDIMEKIDEINDRNNKNGRNE